MNVEYSPGGKRRYRKYSLLIGNVCYLLKIKNFYVHYLLPLCYFCIVVMLSQLPFLKRAEQENPLKQST